MRVLTKNEISIMQGKSPASGAGKRAIEEKLSDLQESLTQVRHIVAVNKHIDAAETEATEKAMVDGILDKHVFDKEYHKSMNRRTRAAGLRV